MFFKRDENNDKKQPGSSDIWNDLHNAESGWCCKFLDNALQQMPHARYLQISMPNGEFVMMRMNHCPRCGRKL